MFSFYSFSLTRADCEMLVCREALLRFESIVGVLAGQQELIRAKQLLESVTVVPDYDDLKVIISLV